MFPESITDFHLKLAERKTTVEEVVKSYIDVINLKNKNINAFLEVFEEAIVVAKACDTALVEKSKDEMLAIFQKQKMFGVPFAIKDSILIKDHIASASSKMLENYVASYDATVITKLKESGAIFLGRVNMDEFAMGGSTENSAFGVTKNPLNTDYVSGGTSGGSAAAVAMSGCLVALGSDTGGSIRQPASYCGVVGLKPTYGSVSRHGLMAMASSFDVIGPITKNIEDAKAIFEVIKGIDPLDSTSHDVADTADTADTASTDKKSTLKVGIPREFIFTEGVSSEVKESMTKTIEKLESAGVEVVDISVPLIKHSLAMYYILVLAEVSSNMARYDGVRYGKNIEGKDLLADYTETRGQLLGSEVKRRIMLGTYILSAGYHDAYYKKAMALREELVKDIQKVFDSVDVILTPTTPSTAFKIGEKVTDPLELYLSDIFTVTANLVGMPAISLPYIKEKDSSGEAVYGTENNLPLGIQFMANTDREDILFAIGKMIY